MLDPVPVGQDAPAILAGSIVVVDSWIGSRPFEVIDPCGPQAALFQAAEVHPINLERIDSKVRRLYKSDIRQVIRR